MTLAPTKRSGKTDGDPQPMTPLTLPKSARIDLHMHTNLSDGRYPPDEVLRRCALAKLDLVAITDHDLPPAWPRGWTEVDGHRLYLLHAAEVSGVYEGTEQHLLVYFPGEMPEGFRELCRTQAQLRAERYEIARGRLNLDGVPPADPAARAGERALTRLHLAQAVAAAGHTKSTREAMDRYLAEGRDLVPNVTLDWFEAIRIARAHGGLCSWAHPSIDRAKQWTRTFAAAGLQGLEALRPGTGGAYRSQMRQLARKSNLFLTGGSDFHGWSPGVLGEFAIDAQQADGFLRALAA